MDAFIEPLQGMTEFREIRTKLHAQPENGVLELSGCSCRLISS